MLVPKSLIEIFNGTIVGNWTRYSKFLAENAYMNTYSYLLLPSWGVRFKCNAPRHDAC